MTSMQSAKRPRLQQTKEIVKPEEQLDATAEVAPWQLWCRLCAKDDPDNNVTLCKSEDSRSSLDNTLVTAIGKYFWVNIRENDQLSKFLCAECHTLITWLISFTERVNKVQTMYCMLQNSKVDANELRKQYGLLDAERDHIIRSESEESVSGVQIKILHQDYEDDEEGDKDEDEYQLELENVETLQEENEMDVIESDDEGELNFQFVDEAETAVQLVSKDKKEKNMLCKSNDMTDKVLKTDEEEESPEKSVLAQIKHEKSADVDTTATEEEVDDSDLFKELKYKDCENELDEAEDHIEDEKKLLKKHKPSSEACAANERRIPRRRGRPSKFPELSREILPLDTDSDCTEPKYQCSVCGKSYKNPTSYRKHMKELHQTTPEIPDFKCNVCAKIFPTERQLGMHARSHLPLEEKLDVPCPYCDRKFTKAAVMRQHINGMHYDMKPYICDGCGRALKTLAALNEHKLVHTNATPFKCEVCQKGFKNKARLKVHSEVHAETSYVCTLCGLKLNTRRTLKMHMLVHSDNKRFKCDFCQAAFKRSKALKNHLILHTGMRPYTCNFCNKTFSNGSNCRAHKKKTHPKELAEEEAQGKKAESVIVPKLNDLRSSKFIVENPRKVQRHAGGLTPHMRALLIAAEERAKRSDDGNKFTATDSQSEPDTEPDDSQSRLGMQFIEGTAMRETYGEGEDVEIADVAEDEDDEEEETVIYEIIDEI